MKITFRVSVVGLFIDGDEVLLLHQITGPEPDRWDLPGGGLEPGETLLAGLAREVKEEVGLQDFQVKQLLTVVEGFYPKSEDELAHTLNIVYHCFTDPKPLTFSSQDPEIGPLGIRWHRIRDLTPESCSQRTWAALAARRD